MAKYLLPEKILQEQICSICHKYLSFSPIKGYSDGLVKCGRCSEPMDDGARSIINELFKNIRFPCVNRYEGCTHLLNFQDVSAHEITCLGEQYLCPMCPESKYKPNSLLFLLHHYRIYHKPYLITDPYIFIDCEMLKEQMYLYCNNSENKITFVRIRGRSNLLFIEAAVAGNGFDVDFDINVYKYDKNRELVFHTSAERCSEMGFFCNRVEIDIESLSMNRNCTVLCAFKFNTLRPSVIPLSPEYVARGDKRKLGMGK